MRAPLRVLIVEDSADDAELAFRALRTSGFDLSAERVEAAAELERALAERAWDIVIADYSLPAFGGIGALEIVRRLRPELPFVIVSGTINDEMAVAALRAGAHDYVLKGNLTRLGPVVARELHEAELRARHRRAEDELRALRERTAAELERSRNQLDVILRGVAEEVVAQDAQGRVIYLNDMAAQAFGVAATGARPGPGTGADALLARFEVWDESGEPVLAAAMPGRTALATGRPVERVLRVKDREAGTERWYIVTSTPIAGSPQSGPMVITISRDITERKRAEDNAKMLADATPALSSSLDYTNTLQNVAKIAVPRLAEWCVLAVDEPPRVVIVHARPELVPRVRAWWQGRAPSRDQVRASCTSGAPELLHEIDIDGARSALIVPLHTHGPPTGALVLASATSRRYTLDDLALAEEIARRGALAAENARLFQESQEAIRVRNEFLSIASHELRTPVTALLLGLEALLRMPPERRAAVLEDQIGKSIRHTKRLAKLIESLLDVSRITTGRLAVHREEFDLAEFAAEVVDRFRHEAARAGCSIEFSGRAVRGAWDRLRMDQVLSNLLSNAIKYGAGKPIRVELEATPTSARLAVRDHGLGIAPQDVARIFQRFERAVSGKHYGGLGLGLFIARQIVEAHGGTITVESTPGAGSTFSVELPRREAAVRAPTKQEAADTPSR